MNAQVESPELSMSPIEVEHAFDRMLVPQRLTALLPDAAHGDETARARQALSGAIAQRLGQGEEHRVAGRIADAIRSFESVLIFDRKNELACARLAQLRPNVPPTSRLDWIGRTFCARKATSRRGCLVLEGAYVADGSSRGRSHPRAQAARERVGWNRLRDSRVRRAQRRDVERLDRVRSPDGW
jgi:hypothetical protein